MRGVFFCIRGRSFFAFVVGGGSAASSATDGASQGRVWSWRFQRRTLLPSDSARHHGDSDRLRLNRGRADRSRRPFFILQVTEWDLHLFLRACVRSGIPHAASLGAVGGSLGGFYVLGESRAGESKCECQSKNRDQGLHEVFSLTLGLSSDQTTRFWKLRFQERPILLRV